VFYGRNIDHGYKYSLHSADFEKTSTIKDLGVIFDPELSFRQHCTEKINKAYAMLGIIKRNFIYLSEEAIVSLYKTLVRSHLEYANSVWNPYRMGLIKDLKKVQMRATKLVIQLKHLRYKERLERLKLPTLRYRRTREDMIEVYKILTERYCKSVNLELELHKKSVTGVHNLKLVNSRCHYDLRKYSFAVRVVCQNSVISANNVNTFKNRLDKFWANQEKSSLAGTGNRSFVDSSDIIDF